MSLPILAGLGVLVFVLAGAALLIPGKPRDPSPVAAPVGYAPPQPVPIHAEHAAAPPRAVSYRDQMLDEDASALAAEFRAAKRDQYLAALRTEAAGFFAPTKATKSTS